MKNEHLRDLVTAAVRLDCAIAQHQATLETYKARLIAEADKRRKDAIKTKSGGRSITFSGAEGFIARVTATSATLMSTLKANDKNLPEIKKLAGRCFGTLFPPEIVYKFDKEFRAKATKHLGKKNAAKLMRLVTAAGKVSVSFETKAVAS